MVLEKDKESPAKKVTTRSAGKIQDSAEESKPAVKGLFDSKEVSFENSGDDKVTVEYKPKNGKIDVGSGQTKSLPKETTTITFNGQTISLVDPDKKNVKHIFFYDNLVLTYSICSPKSDEKAVRLVGVRDYRASNLDFGQLCGNLSSFTLDEDALSKAKLCAFYSKRAYDLQLYVEGHTEEDLYYAHHDIKEQISFTRWAVWYNEASKRIVLAFRGSSEVYDFLVDAGIYPKRLLSNFGISSGTLTMIENEWESIAEQIGKIVTAHGGGKDLSLLLTGHSLGGGLAQTLLMLILLKMKDEHSNAFVDIPRENIQLWTFAGQNVFYKFYPDGSDWHSGLDAETLEVFERFESASHNFANLYDPVPFSPRVVATEYFGPTIEYKARAGVENILSKHTGGSLIQKVVDPLIKKLTPGLTKLSESSSFCQYYHVLAQTVVLYVDKKGQQLYLGVSAGNYPEMLSRCLSPSSKKTSIHPWLGHMSVSDHSLSEGEGDEQVGYLPVLSKF